LWDTLPPDVRKNISGLSSRYSCTANHESFSHPTTLRSDYSLRLVHGTREARTSADTVYSSSRYSSDTDSSDGSSSDGSISDRSTDVSISNSVAAAPPVTPLFSPSRGILQGYKDEISSQKREIDALKKKIPSVNKTASY
jgi:hypothetical protein